MLMQAQVAGRGGSLLYAANFGLRARGRDENFGDQQVGSELVAGAALGFIAFDDRVVVGPEILSSTVFSDGSHNFLNRPGTPVELTIGGHLEVVEDFRLGLGVGPGLTPGMGSPAVRYLFSLEWAPGREPAEPERPAAPRSLRDRDGDGIADGADQCPDVPGVVSSDPALNGCPATVDTDADGIADQNDACPTLAGPANSEPSKNGCPLAADTDGDGIIDAEDACPSEHGVPDLKDRTRHGCPLPADSDGDGILDAADACPQHPGPPNTNPKKNGCPRAVVTESKIEIFDRVEFETGKATLRAESTELLTAVAAVLKEHPEIKKVSIEGHTDDRGSGPFNLDLSRRRAASVLNWLARNGIDATRLTSAGFGLEQPIESNATDEGRQNNRRVEFKIVERGAKPAE
jgi:outer membrane protein OmpA-like peptidoglycan-associated protein